MTVGIATNTGGTVVFAIRRDSVACKSIDCFGTSELRCFKFVALILYKNHLLITADMTQLLIEK